MLQFCEGAGFLGTEIGGIPSLAMVYLNSLSNGVSYNEGDLYIKEIICFCITFISCQYLFIAKIGH